ncbi:hypothetical protein BC940DRAFT_304701 [Gongronella butleri]|nr:hypothetical protein BC940DRAFT_304701 [Gongronella butleri]
MTTASRHGKAWTEQELATLVARKEANVSDEQIAIELGRKATAVKLRYKQHCRGAGARLPLVKPCSTSSAAAGSSTTETESEANATPEFPNHDDKAKSHDDAAIPVQSDADDDKNDDDGVSGSDDSAAISGDYDDCDDSSSTFGDGVIHSFDGDVISIEESAVIAATFDDDDFEELDDAVIIEHIRVSEQLQQPQNDTSLDESEKDKHTSNKDDDAAVPSNDDDEPVLITVVKDRQKDAPVIVQDEEIQPHSENKDDQAVPSS